MIKWKTAKRTDLLAAWTFHEGADVIGHKWIDDGVRLLEAHGRTLAEARTVATEVERVVRARSLGRREQNKVAADALRAQADLLEAS